MINIAVVDDEQEFRQTICSYIQRYSESHEAQLQATCFHDGLDIADEYQARWDIIFLDIRMEHLDGMAAARRIRALDPNVILVFITTLAQYAIHGYEVNALDFVLKPLNYPQFEMRLFKAIREVEKHRQKKYIFLKKWNDWIKLSTDEILFIEVKGHTLNYVTETDVYEKRATIAEAEKELQGMFFVRSSQPYLINLKRIDRISGDEVILGPHHLPISRNRKKDFLQQFTGYLEAEY